MAAADVAAKTLIEALRALLDLAEADGWSTRQITDLLARIARPVVVVEPQPLSTEAEAFYRRTHDGVAVSEIVDFQAATS